MITTAPTLGDEFRRAAEIVEANELDSDAWLQSLTYFDLIRADTAPEVLSFAQSLRGQRVEPSLLAGLLAVQGQIAGAT